MNSDAADSASATEVLLHLSDLHFGDHKYPKNLSHAQAHKSGKKLILEALLKTLSILEDEWKPTAVCISGDIAFDGSKEDYLEAEEWIGKLLTLLKLTSDDLVMCPGNHDVHQPDVPEPPSDAAEADKLFSVPLDEADMLHKAFTEYSSFCERLGVPKFTCGSVRSHLVGVRNIRGVKFLGMNTAWFATGPQAKDRGRLWLGLPLLKYMDAEKQIRQLDADDSEFVVSLMHHPVDWLNASENYQYGPRKKTVDLLYRRASVLLTGHTHDSITEPTAQVSRCWHFPGGAVFDSEEHGNSFRLLKIDANKIHPRSYAYDPQSSEDEWIPRDTSVPVPKKVHPQMWERVTAGLSLTKPSSGMQTDIDSEIKRCISLLQDNKFVEAESELSDLLIKAKQNKASDLILAKIVNIRGLCLLNLHMMESAILTFEKALQYDDSNAIIHANLAQAFLQTENLGSAQVAIDKARNLNHLNPHVLNVYSSYLIKSDRRDLFEGLLLEFERAGDNSKESLLLRAQLNLDARNFEESTKLLEENFPVIDDLSPAGKEMLACSLIGQIRDKVAELPEESKKLPPDLRFMAVRAKQLLDDVTQGETKLTSREKLSLFINRSAVHSMLDEWEAAVQDYDRLLLIDPKNEQVVQARILALVGSGRLDEAAVLVSSTTESLLVYGLAQALIAVGGYTKALDVLSHMRTASDDDKVRKMGLQISAFKRLGKEAEVSQLIVELRANFAGHHQALALLAEDAYEHGDPNEAISLLHTALSKEQSESSRNLITQNLANLLCVLSKSEDAIQLLESANYKDNVQLLKSYASALYYGGRYDDALRLIEAHFDDWKNDAEIVGIYAQILESVGAFDKAIDVASLLVNLDPENIGYKLKLSRLQPPLGKRETAMAILNSIDPQLALKRSEYICPLAFQYLSLGESDKALETIYIAREKYFSDPDVHQAYLDIYLSLPSDHPSKKMPGEVAVGDTVTFEQGNVTRTFTLVDDRQADLKRQEIDSESAMGKMLLSAKVGEERVVKETQLERSSIRINSIFTKYGYAFFQTLNEYSTWFPHRNDLQKGDITQLDALMAVIKQQQDRAELVIATYRDSKLPMAAAALALGKTVPELWLDIIGSADMNFQFSLGTDEDTSIQLANVHASKTIVLDTCAILTVTLLEIEDLVHSKFERVLVSGTVLAELEQAIRSESTAAISQLPSNTSRGILSDSRLRLLKRAQSFALSLNALGSPSLFEQQFAKLIRLYGQTAIATLLVSQAEAAAVYSDDLAFRMVMSNERNMPGFGVQALLMQLRESRLLSPDGYSQLISRLLRHKYWYVMIQSQDLLRIFRHDKGLMTDDFRALASVLGRPCELIRINQILMEFMGHLWFRGTPFSISERFLAELLRHICLSHDQSLVGSDLKSRVEKQYGNRSWMRSAILKSLDDALKAVK
jgi:tetratricopeptide (TPR) repeat protein/3',5'-cyclic AMP phosphodiesterase CpdA